MSKRKSSAIEQAPKDKVRILRQHAHIGAADKPHPATDTDAGTGQGTLSKMPRGKTLNHPVLDGSTESAAAQRSTENPFRGRTDPAMGEWRYTDTGSIILPEDT